MRSCDGYYFPISYSTTRDHFQSDEETCEQMCPAAPTDLYVHDIRKGGPEDMVSLDGKPYSELPSAFAYRAALDPACTCGTAELSASVAEPSEKPAAVSPALPPRPRSSPGEDPETLANRAGHLDLSSASEPGMASLGDEPGNSVRVVWPDWQSQQGELVISAVPN